MNSFFCKSSGLGVAVKLLINAAGVAVARNNIELAKTALPIAKGILEVIDKGIDNEAVNNQLREVITALVEKSSNNPAIVAAISIALSDLNIDLTGKFPTFDNAEIKDILNSFIAGAEAGIR
jgi:hypothetical protein